MSESIATIIKRDGRQVSFSLENVVRAIEKAGKETKAFDKKEAKRLAGIVQGILEKVVGVRKEPITVEHIQDIVEQVLMAAGHFKTAKAYILYRAEHAKIRKAETIIGVENDLNLSLNQLKVIERRYLLHDLAGKPTETPAQMFRRVARTLAGVEKKAKRKKLEEQFYEVMTKLEFLPGGRTLNNAGTPQNQLANCFVLPVDDSMEGIFDAVKWTALVHRTGGGTGFSFTSLRPRGDSITKSSGGFATGPVSFMKVFDVATRQVMQGGKQRGANMGILAANHPDIQEFITCKSTDGEISNFNISVGATDEFMSAVEKDKEFALRNPRTQEVVQKVSARLLMDQIVSLAWRTGDPGMIYWDAINKNNPLMDSVGPIYATNPCVTGDTIVATPKGWKAVAEIHEGDEIYTVKGVGKVKTIEVHEQAEVFQVTFGDGTIVHATAAHQFFASTWNERESKLFHPVRLDRLRPGDIVQRFQTLLEKKDIPPYGRIVSIKPIGTAKVYDLYEPESDTWITNSYVSRGCGEQPLHPFDSCNLGSINLAAFVRDEGEKHTIDWERLGFVTKTAVRMLDNVIDACKYPLPQIAKTVKQNRRIGLGVMGWADMLLHLGIAYNSDEGVRLAGKVMKFVQEQSWIASEELAKEKSSFPRWNKSWFAQGYDPNAHAYINKRKPRKFRNVAITTIAPTGTISMAADCSSGIEPVFALCYVKNVVDASGLTYVNKYFEKALQARIGNNGEFQSLVARVSETGSVAHVDGVDKEMKRIFVTAHDIAWEWHVKMQAAFQKYTDNAVSKTINFPSSATLDEIRGAYVMAWKMGCKGITVYRDKSKGYQVLAVKADGEGEKNKKDSIIMQSQVRHTPLAERSDFAAILKQEVQRGDVVDVSTDDEEQCPECSAVMQNQEGCNLCLNCGYSKCKL